MAYVSAQHNNDRFLPGIAGNPIKGHEEFHLYSLCYDPNVLTIFLPDWRMLRRFRCVQTFL